MSENNFVGLTNKEAEQRLLADGPNRVQEKRTNRVVLFLQKFWAPVPWMLELTIIFEIMLHKYDEAIIISLLLIFNAVLSFMQEGRANKALLLLYRRLSVQARVLRDGYWQIIQAENLVKDDIVHLRMGDISPADITLLTGKVMIDQSSLTGEAMPVEAGAGKMAYSGSVIKQGEATGKVMATGSNTYFGKTVSLIQTAKSVSHVKNIIFSIVKYLIIFSAVLTAFIIVYALRAHLPLTEIVPFILILLIAAIPAALPAMFTLATALGALKLVTQGVLVTRLSAIEEASVMDIICVDKTGTITQNKLEVAMLCPIAPYAEATLLYYAFLASDEATQDPIDQAILAKAKGQPFIEQHAQLLEFIPFDPMIKRTEAIYKIGEKTVRIIKGSLDVIRNKIEIMPDISNAMLEMGNKGYRILAVAMREEEGTNTAFTLIGLIGLFDPPREDSKSVVEKLKALGLRVLMLTGDHVVTAKSIAESVGIGTRVCSANLFKEKFDGKILDFDVFANLFPEEKFILVKNLQQTHHVVGMTGDGVNDAPSLKQAEVGVAVANASDVAKAAASLVLTRPGLDGILFAVETSRRVYQRMHTYILNKVSKSVELSVFLTTGLLLTGELILTPLLMVLLMFANDFVTMSIATDNATCSAKPERWQMGKIMWAGGIIGLCTLIFSIGVFYYVKTYLILTLPELQTLVFVLLAFTAQSNVYIIRERHCFWHSVPSKWLIISSCFGILLVSSMAAFGILMTPISLAIIIKLFMLTIIYFLITDYIKVKLFSYFNLV